MRTTSRRPWLVSLTMRQSLRLKSLSLTLQRIRLTTAMKFPDRELHRRLMLFLLPQHLHQLLRGVRGLRTCRP